MPCGRRLGWVRKGEEEEMKGEDDDEAKVVLSGDSETARAGKAALLE